jgi:hypothetical protein
MTGLFFGFTLRNGTLVPDEGVTVNAKKLARKKSRVMVL